MPGMLTSWGIGFFTPTTSLAARSSVRAVKRGRAVAGQVDVWDDLSWSKGCGKGRQMRTSQENGPSKTREG